MLIDRRARTSHLVLRFERQADLLWSPDGRYIAVTHWLGSNVSEVLVVEVARARSPKFRDALERGACGAGEAGDRRLIGEYEQSVEWVRPGRLRVDVLCRKLLAGGGVEDHVITQVFDAHRSKLARPDAGHHVGRMR